MRHIRGLFTTWLVLMLSTVDTLGSEAGQARGAPVGSRPERPRRHATVRGDAVAADRRPVSTLDPQPGATRFPPPLVSQRKGPP